MSSRFSQTADHIDVGYVARLARLELTEEERAGFQTQLEQILDYVQQLAEVDVSDVTPTAHAVPVANVLRRDEVQPGLDPAEVLQNAPRQRDGQFLVPKIVE